MLLEVEHCLPSGQPLELLLLHQVCPIDLRIGALAWLVVPPSLSRAMLNVRSWCCAAGAVAVAVAVAAWQPASAFSLLSIEPPIG